MVGHDFVVNFIGTDTYTCNVQNILRYDAKGGIDAKADIDGDGVVEFRYGNGQRRLSCPYIAGKAHGWVRVWDQSYRMVGLMGV